MTYQELIDKLSMHAQEYREREVKLYDTLTGHLYNLKELLYIDDREETINDPDVPGTHIHQLGGEEGPRTIDAPPTGRDVVVLTF